MRLDPPLRTTAPSPASPEHELVQITDELIEAVRQGRIPDRAALLARYPHHADRLDGLIQAAEMVVDLRASASGNASAADLSDSSIETEVPKQLGDFEILRELGKGGMGVVYEARQISLQRRVALKILPFASVLDSRQLQRFKNESLAAAQLNHPHIVDVYGVGCERGVHYYAMRLIEGQSLAEILNFLRRSDQSQRETETDSPSPHEPESSAGDLEASPALRASLAETPVLAALSTDRARRSEFFRTVARIGIEAAEALHHAHEQGVIHRDVKPSNLLIDGRGRVWVADFGLAHIETGAELTLSGELMGTLRYMSPEQASGQRLGIDHRTDVYSLGVTLYELLTLRAPFEAPTRSELLRQILFDDPRPPRRYGKDVPADLETIVLKCLEKAPAERYVSARELADDLSRFVDGQAVNARRSRRMERAWRWARRNRGIAALFALVVLLLLGLTAGSIAAALAMNSARNRERSLRAQAEQARNEATTARNKAQHAEGQARENAERALAEAEVARKTTGFLEQLFQSADVSGFDGSGFHEQLPQSNADLSSRQIVMLGARRLRGELHEQPLVRAQLLTSVGLAALNLGMLSEARPLLAEAVEIHERHGNLENAAGARALTALARIEATYEKYPQAIRLLERAYKIQLRELGRDHLDVAATETSFGWVAIEWGHAAYVVQAGERLRHALEIRSAQLGPRDTETQVTLLLYLLWENNQSRNHVETIEKLQRIVAGIDRDGGSAILKAVLLWESAGRHQRQNELDLATDDVEEAISEFRRAFGPGDHPLLLRILEDAVWIAQSRGDLCEMKRLMKEELQMGLRLIGDAPRIFHRRLELADRYVWDGELRAAAPLLEALFIDGGPIQDPIWAFRLRAWDRASRGEYDLAHRDFESSLEEISEQDKSPGTRRLIHQQLAVTEACRGRWDRALALCGDKTAMVLSDTIAADHAAGDARDWRAVSVLLGRHEDVSRWTSSFEGNVERLPRKPQAIYVSSWGNWCAIAAEMGRHPSFEGILRDWLTSPLVQSQPSHPFGAAVKAALADILIQREEWDTAEALSRESLATRERMLGPAHPDTVVSMFQLARIRLARGDRAEAERLGRDALVRRTETTGADHPYTWAVSRELARVLRHAGQFLEAEQRARESLRLTRDTLGIFHPDYADSVAEVALSLIARGDNAAAAGFLEPLLAELLPLLPEHNPSRAWLAGIHAESRLGALPDSELLPTLQQSCDTLRIMWGECDRRTLHLAHVIEERLTVAQRPQIAF